VGPAAGAGRRLAPPVRDGADRRDPDRVVTSRRRVAAIGAVLVVAYVAGAVASGVLDPSLRRPLLDGLAPPPLYRWVEPPPALASTNQRPAAARFTIQLDPVKGSAPGVFSTSDFQFSLALGLGAIAPHGSDTSILLRATPLAPDPGAQVPAGFQIAGNVMRVRATYEPSGTPADRFKPEGALGIVYPLLFQGVGYTDTVLRSDDGRSWTALESDDAIAQQSVHASVGAPGYFAVGQASSSSPGAGGSTGARSIPVAIVIVAVLIGAFAVLRRRSQRPPPRPPRPPSDDDAFDPWKV
jgi:hypothetical protein